MTRTTPLALMIDLERCTGCKSCEAACKQTNALGPHTYRNRVMWFDQIAAGPQLAALDFLTVTCQQCERPACVRACPVNPKAITKNLQSGVVAVDESLCTGCGECALACPYGAIGYDAEHHHAVKCDLCATRREAGDGPACASVCPTRAIGFGERDELLALAHAQNREPLDHDHFLQKPATVYLKRLQDHGPDNTRTQAQVAPALMRDHQVRSNLTAAHASGTYAKRDEPRRSTHSTDERIVEGGCHICFNACPVTYHLRGAQVVNIYGNAKDPVFQGRVCPKSQMSLQSYQSPGGPGERLLEPLKRIGERGANEFERVSWAQAIDDIAERLRNIRAIHGAEALAIQAGSRTGTLNLAGIIPMFAGLWGTPNVASTEPFCDLGKSVALQLTQGTAMLANVYTEQDIGSAQLYVYVGDNQAETRPVNFGMVNDWRLRNGARMVVVDPRMTPTASKADQWLPIRPGTDMALGLALIHSVFDMHMHDTPFCEQWVSGWHEWRQFVIDQRYNAQWAAQITDLAAQDITALARSIASADGCMIFLSRGINQHSNSAQTNRVYMFLAAITGNWGRRGGGFFNVNSEVDWKRPPLPAGRAPQMRPAIARNPAAWVPAMREQFDPASHPYPIRALITGNNPLGQWPDQGNTRQAFSELDLLVHMDLYRNATSVYADYVLPMATGIEKGGTTRFAEDRRIIWNDPLIEPPGQAKSDHWFWIELGRRFGFDDVLKESYKDPATFWDQVMCRHTPTMAGITTEKLKSATARSVRVPLPSAETPDTETLFQTGTTAFGAPAGKRFATPSGTLEFWTPQLESDFAAVGLSALPHFYGEKDQLTDLPHLIPSSTDDSAILSPFFADPTFVRRASIASATTAPAAAGSPYDTDLVTGRPTAPHFHSWTHYFWQAQEMWPELYCQIHPVKAASINVADGDMVQIDTKSGSLKARAWVHKGIRESAVFVPIGWDEHQPFHPGATVNHLTGVTLDPVSQQANLKSHVCRVSRATMQS